jgi:subtilisin family serine protease
MDTYGKTTRAASKVLIAVVIIAIVAGVGFLTADRVLTSRYFEKPYRAMMPNGEVGIVRSVVEAYPYAASGDDLSDLRGTDLRGRDLSKFSEALLLTEFFDTETKWPTEFFGDFDPYNVLEYGKYPGLRLRELHDMGVDGTGVSIGVVDFPLRTDHTEYADRLKHYEDVYVLYQKGSLGMATFHGSAVASIALGKDVGVAPGSNLYFIAADNTRSYLTAKHGFLTSVYFAEAIERLLDINDALQETEKIRVISISWAMDSASSKELEQALVRAEESGVYVVHAGIARLAGLGRFPSRDPDNFDSYTMGIFERSNPEFFSGRIFFPMDARTVAGTNSAESYVYTRNGGFSWVVPYVAGLYALCAQVYPNINQELFWDALEKTSIHKALDIDGNGSAEYTIAIANPFELIMTCKDF